jgi:hypothetical protein
MIILVVGVALLTSIDHVFDRVESSMDGSVNFKTR